MKLKLIGLIAGLAVAGCGAVEEVDVDSAGAGDEVSAQESALGTVTVSMETAVRAACRVAKNYAPAKEWTCQLVSQSRNALVDGLVEYEMKFKVGSGPNDVIGLHRVVRVGALGEPETSTQPLFMIHGDVWGFDAAFVRHDATTPSTERSAALYFASLGMDVWGIDLRWVNVGADVTDLTFMRNWGMQTHVHDVDEALMLARVIRTRTGNSFARVHLLGWSSGAAVAYAYANQETQFAERLKQVRTLVPVDIAFRTDPANTAAREFACSDLAAVNAQLAAGTFASNTGALTQGLGYLASTRPGRPSELVPGLTNRQAALMLAGATYQFAPLTPTYHLAGATFSAEGLPLSLAYTGTGAYFAFMQRGAPYQSLGDVRDLDQVGCGNARTPFDDHLAAIRVPTFYLGARGGFGDAGLYTLSLLGSADKTSRIVSVAESPALDFGHADLWLSARAQRQAWTPLHSWLSSR